MSVSLYYEARRSQPITPQEQGICDEIAKRYDAEYPYGELYEGFCIYDLDAFRDESEKDVIFSGATKLPPADDETFLFNVINWWLKCLGEITDHLPGAQWHVNIDDADLPWEEDDHFLFPTENDEE